MYSHIDESRVSAHTSSEALFQSSLHRNVTKKMACISTQMQSPVHSPDTEMMKNVDEIKVLLPREYIYVYINIHQERVFFLTYNPHLCCKHQGDAYGEPDAVISHQVTQSSDQLFSCSSQSSTCYSLSTSNTPAQKHDNSNLASRLNFVQPG